MAKTKLTDAQQRVLNQLSDTDFTFPPNRKDAVCGRLEGMGLVEGRLAPASHNNATGVTWFRRMYRRKKIEG